MKHRLDQLDDFDEGSVRLMVDLSQQEYTARIEQLNSELVQSWNGGQRVKALKIAIQCSKTLSDVSVLQFYPSQFVLITDILDIFGNLVFERLKSKANIINTGKPFETESICEDAKETCQNWFFKIASIRELLPRLYVEMALLRCYSFLSQRELNQSLERITQMIHGIGDPLVAIYARCYLVRVGLLVSTENGYIHNNFNGFLSVYHMIFSGSIRSEMNSQHIDMSTYLRLYEPALDWILNALITKTNIPPDDVLSKCKNMKNNGLLFTSLLNSFEFDYIALNANQLVEILSTSSTEGISKAKLFFAFGKCISKCTQVYEQIQTVAKAALNTIDSFTNADDYIIGIEGWIQTFSEYFSIAEINSLLGDIKTRMMENKLFEKYYSQLQGILDKTIKYCKDFESLLIASNFLPFIDLFKKDSIKLEVCKSIMIVYKNNSEKTITDAVFTNNLMYICKILNNSVNAFTVNDERRQIGNLVSNFVRKVDCGRDFEQKLAYYVEARAAFFNLDSVMETLVYLVNKIGIETCRTIGGAHTNKSSRFVKACIAYSLITIPSIFSIPIKMNLYLLTGEVAISNCCLEQADLCFETALKLISTLPRTIEVDGKLQNTESYLISYLSDLLSVLIVVPDSPEQGVLYLVRLLLDELKKFSFDLHSTGSTIIYMKTLDVLYIQSLPEFPYHISNVVSNDELYGNDSKFLNEINSISSHIIEQILNQLKSFELTNQLKAQASLALDLFLRIIRYGDVCEESVFKLALSLWTLALKNEELIGTKNIVLKTTEEIQLLVSIENEQRSQMLKSIIEKIKRKPNQDKRIEE